MTYGRFDATAFGTRIKALREERNWNQSELIARLQANGSGEISASHLSRLENGKASENVSHELIRAFAQTFNADLLWLATGSSDASEDLQSLAGQLPKLGRLATMLLTLCKYKGESAQRDAEQLLESLIGLLDPHAANDGVPVQRPTDHSSRTPR